MQGKSNLPSFFDGFIAAALSRFDALLWYLSEEVAFLAFFFKAVGCQQKRSMQKGNVAIQTQIQFCSSKITQNGDTKAQKMYKNKNLLGLKSFLIPTRMETAPTFLEVQALQWKNYSNYNFLKKALGKMLIVNDSAERTILLAKSIAIN